MGTGPEGQAAQVFRDRNAKSRWSVLSAPDGDMRQTILDDDANPRINLQTSGPFASINLFDSNKEERLMMVTGPNGPRYLYSDSKGRTRAILGDLGDGTAGVQVYDADGEPVR